LSIREEVEEEEEETLTTVKGSCSQQHRTDAVVTVDTLTMLLVALAMDYPIILQQVLCQIPALEGTF
jgi:hypothetical protein